MRSKFVSELQAMHEDLIQMASLAETAISSSVKALETMDETLAQKVVGSDYQIDELEKEVERRCLRLLLQQQPVARDLRSVSTVLKMITDLERIGDQAADIAEVTVFLCRNRDFQMPEGLREMALAAVKMVRGAIDAFVEENLDKAHEVIGYDDVVDRAFLRTRDELIRQVKQAAGSAEQIMDLLMIAKYLERIGDHAVNTAEWVVFFLTGAHKDAQVI